LRVIAERLRSRVPDELAVLLNGAFLSTPVFELGEATILLQWAGAALIAASVGV
jgi:hypothetical protein